MFLGSFAELIVSRESFTDPDLAAEFIADVFVYPVHAPTLSECTAIGDYKYSYLLPAPSSAGLYLIWIYKLL